MSYFVPVSFDTTITKKTSYLQLSQNIVQFDKWWWAKEGKKDNVQKLAREKVSL